ncbi:hypothetical protein PhCBS80983_g04450 [Powellomyces hirtus]|uniref:Inosine/uridine-preferring nucleoside hydrolase domain-containing protein n=1 Tax=Powellomyces hirtus TaxID=109895 RepID=A0A507DXQ8_9FUNG|nr:hypothetical protein PhCBS80983_g04450 [Powellomyces hirtus]
MTTDTPVSATTHTPQSVIIDTDPGVDDAIALLFAFLSPEIDIRALTITQGNTNVGKCLRNIKQILSVQAAHERFLESDENATRGALHPGSLVSRTHPVVIALGQGQPLEGEAAFAEYYHGADGLGNYFPVESPPDTQSAAVESAAHAAGTTQADEDAAKGLYTVSERLAEDEILHQLNTHPAHTINIVAVGPLSNVARAIQKDPETMKKVKAIYTMGGAINVPGNITPLAEFNWYADALAAHVLVASDLPVYVLPLDVTTVSSVVDSQYLISHALPLHTPLSDFVVKITQYVLDLTERQWGNRFLTMHDPLTVGALVDPSLITFQPLDFQVEPAGTFSKAFCVVDRRQHPAPGAVGGGDAAEPPAKRTNIKVAVKGDTRKFLSLFYKTLFGLDWDAIKPE